MTGAGVKLVLLAGMHVPHSKRIRADLISFERILGGVRMCRHADADAVTLTGYKCAMDPTIIFICPADVSALAEAVAEYSGTIEFETSTDPDEARVLLGAHVGKPVTVEFPLPIDPMDLPFDAVERIARVLETDGASYVYFVDAFVEPSRGVRVPGRIVLNEGAGPETLLVPWEHGEPHLDLPTLLAAGMAPERASSTISRWMRA